MRYGYDVCVVCGAPVVSVTSGHPAWLSSCRAVVDGYSGLSPHVSDVGQYSAGQIFVDEQVYPVDWSVYHATSNSIRTYSLARPEYPVHDACWKMMCQVLPANSFPCVTKFLREKWQEKHELFYYHRRRQPKAKQVLTCSVLSHSGLDFAAEEPGSEACEYMKRLAGVQKSWLGFEYDETFLCDPLAVPPVIFKQGGGHSLVEETGSHTVNAEVFPAPDYGHSNSGQFSCLPVEVVEVILAALDLRTFVSVLCTSKQACTSNLSTLFWKQQCLSLLPFLRWDVLSNTDTDQLIDWQATFLACLASSDVRNGLRIWNIVNYVKQELHPVQWHTDALGPLNRLPSRFRTHARRLVEVSARRQNVSLVTKAFYYEAADQGNLVGLLTGQA